MLAIPGCIGLCKVNRSLRTIFSTPLAPGLDCGPGRERTLQLIRDLDEWTATQTYISAAPGNRYAAAGMTSLTSSETLPAGQGLSLVLLDSSICMTRANHEAFCPILHLLLENLNTDPEIPMSLYAYRTQFFSCMPAMVLRSDTGAWLELCYL
ncbi:hypothetical protein BS50DRAFT_595212 [Corynespora cassiicola Philippines]|uniref:Uncharacterized protein n=1 Tax=Corynespora cassiicola Philippines TaxID=1448308 RepID=A0A2T2MZX4_CORCC|nr:hypothetical protein BS50DRAFT_595212 [Corynespora cassiicola Philippines]